MDYLILGYSRNHFEARCVEQVRLMTENEKPELRLNKRAMAHDDAFCRP